MASAKAASEPSMEEILASIRQIIADEDAPESEAKDVKDQAAIDDAFDNADVGDNGGAEMSTDDVDALFDTPEPAAAAEEENDQAAIDAAFDTPAADEGEEMSTDDVDALFGADDAGDAPAEDDKTDSAAEDDDVLALSVDQTVDEDDISFDMADDKPEAPAEPVAEAAEQPSAEVMPAAALLSKDAAGAVMSSFGALNSTMSVSSTNTVEDLMKSMLRPMLKQWLDENLPETVERLVQAEIERMRNQ